MLALADLKDMTQDQIKDHIANNYGSESYELDPKVAKQLLDLEILIAYESVGSWGCDSSSFFLFKGKDGTLYEMQGSHCSCMGFENQFSLEETNTKTLKMKKPEYFTGGYDNNADDNVKAVNEFIDNLK